MRPITTTGILIVALSAAGLVTISQPANAADPAPLPLGVSLSGPGSVSESARDVTYTLSLSRPAVRVVKVRFGTQEGTAVSHKRPDFYPQVGPYVPGPSKRRNTITFKPGETSKTVTVDLRSDISDEDDETFNFGLFSASVPIVGDNIITTTILDDDTSELTISDVTVAEPKDATRVRIELPIELTALLPQRFSIGYATADGTAVGGGARDYVRRNATKWIPSGFPYRSIPQSIVIIIKRDAIPEGTESFFINLTPSLTREEGGPIPTDLQAEVTITDE